MNITDKLEQEELLRVLIASSLWDTREEVEDAVEKMEGFVVLSGDGKPIDEAIGDYFIDDGDIAGSVPAQWVAYIDSEAVGVISASVVKRGGRLTFSRIPPAVMVGTGNTSLFGTTEGGRQ